MKSLYKTWLLALLALTLPQIAVAYQIPTTPNGSWTGTGTTVPATPATKDTPSGLRTTISLTGAAMTFSARSDTTLMMSNNTTVPLLPSTTNGVQVLATVGGGGCNNTSLTCTGLGTMTIAFTDTAGNPVKVRNPKLHLSRLGGSVSNGTNTTLFTDIFTLTTAGVTLGAPSTGAVNLSVTGDNQVQANLSTLTATGVGACANAGCGTIPVTGTTSQLTFNVSAVRNNTLVNWNNTATAGDAIFITTSFDEDYGDAPASYDAGSAASHIISDLALGATITAENPNTANGGADGSTTVASSPNAVAAGANNNGTNGDGASDDGVSSFPALTTAASGSSYTVPVSLSGASSAGQVCGWIDFNKNTTFDSASERACASFASGATSANLTWTVPAGITVGNTYVRLRASYDSTGVQNPTGRLNSGEVEDYQIAIIATTSVSGTLYVDSNVNNSFDSGEPTLPANVTVTLYKDTNNNNQIDVGEQVGSPVTTNASGNYTFTNVINDTYKIKVDTADTDISSGYVIKTSNDLSVTVNGANITSQNFGFITLPSSFPSCDARPFIAYGSPTDTLGALNTNTLTLDTVGTTTTLYNAIGYNSANNLIYGIQRPTNTTTNADSNNLLAIGSNGVPVNLGAVSDLPLTNFYNAGDVASDGFYYVVNGNTANTNKTFYKIDINPTSPTYKRVVGQFNLSANYNTTNFFFGDIAFNSVDKQIYAVVNNSTNTSQQLIKIDPSSGTAIAIGTATTTDTDNFIGLFVDRTGNNVYGYQGSLNQMWRYNTTTGARVLLANNLQTANSNADGTRCYDTPPIAPDLKISQTASSSRFAVGAANQSYSITVSIPATSTGITSVHGTITFTDQLPNGITIASTPTGTGWNCSASSGQNISCTYTGSLPVSNNSNLGGVITVPVNVAAAAVGTNKQSTATVPTLSAELNTSDNTATVAVDVVMSLNAQVLVVKRITAINGDRAKNPNDNTPLNSFVDDTTSTRKDDDNNPMWKSNYLLGAIDAGKVKPGDEIEYTVYFLNPGGANANNVRLCDRITANQDFKVGAYGTSKDMQLQLGTSTVLDLTSANDSLDRAQFISAGGTVLTNCYLKATNDNGTLVIDVTGNANTGVPNLTTLPGSTAQATPNDSYGFFRFITKVKP